VVIRARELGMAHQGAALGAKSDVCFAALAPASPALAPASPALQTVLEAGCCYGRRDVAWSISLSLCVLAHG